MGETYPNMKKMIVMPHIYITFYNTYPKEWTDIDIVTIEEFEQMETIPDDVEVYSISDSGYDIVSSKLNIIEQGFCNELALLCNDKYLCRTSMETLQDIEFTVCDDNIVNWPYNTDDILFAKPLGGFGSKNLSIVKHGDILPDIGDDYIIEKYIDDVHPRVDINGYLCGDEIGVLSVMDNIYDDEIGYQLKYFIYPSTFSNNQKLLNKYNQVVAELKEQTGCNNCIINIEFFIVDGEPIVMEINPRIGVNYLPIFHVTGYNPWKAMEDLKRGNIPSKTEQEGVGICRYNYIWNNNSIFMIQNNSNTFSLITSAFSHSYNYSYI